MKRLIILIWTLICLNTVAQPIIDNGKAHRRYWYYRTRFINDFVKIGGEQGDCIAFPERNYLWGASTSAKVGPDQIDIMNQYLSALALEYKILSRSNQSTNETIKEIFYILETYNRLDDEADPFWSGTPPEHLPNYNGNNLNGFMLREDMPHDYFDTTNTSALYHPKSKNNYLHFNYAKKEYNFSPTSANSSYVGLEEIHQLTTDNKFSNYNGFTGIFDPNLTKKDLSCVMDKYLSMFNAFMLLIKYIPDNTGYVDDLGVTHYFKDNVFDIKTEVRNITNRCHPYIRGNTFGGSGSNWVLEYPDGNTLDVGAYAIPYSYPLAKMVCYINGGYPWGWPCNAYQDGNSLTTGFVLYNALYLNPIPSITPTLGSEDAAVFLGNVMAGSNAPVYTPTWPPIPIPAAIAMDLNTSLNSIEWADLLRRVHHQSGVLMKQKSVYANPINVAPCKGPYNYGGGNDTGFEWRSQDRLEHPKSRITNTPPPANYPGVDYMLLHNLYYEYLNQLDDNNSQTGKYKNAYNLMDNYDEKTWPQTIVINQALNITFGVNQLDAQHSPMPIKVFQNLTSRAQIYGTTSPLAPLNTISSKVIYRAGKDITLLPEDPINGHPGFEVKAGSDFTAYIERYICGNSDYENGMRQNQNANSTAYSNDYEMDTMNVDVSIHYVEYPKSDSDLSPQNSEEEPVENFTSIEQQQILLQQQLIEKQLADQGIYNTIKTLNQRFLITPNPNNGVFMIYVNKISDDEFFSISIIDMKGAEVKRLTDVNSNLEVQMNLTEFSEGIYMVKLFSNKGFNALKKISVN